MKNTLDSGLHYALKRVVEFHEKFDLHVTDIRTLPRRDDRIRQGNKNMNGVDIRLLRMELMKEEVQEYIQAESNHNYLEVADALADIIVIALGTAASYGIPLHAVFNEVMDSNEKKLDENGDPIYRKDGKLLKPAGWEPPNIAGAITRYQGLLYTT